MNLPPIDASLIEGYYAVAAHLKSNAESMLRTAEMLAQTADRMCEENARTMPMPASPDQTTGTP